MSPERYIYRLILQENEILFLCNRRLEQYVELAPNKPKNIDFTFTKLS